MTEQIKYNIGNGHEISVEYDENNSTKITRECLEMLIKKEIPKRVFANSKREFTNEDFKGIRNTRYYCPCCKRPTKNDVTYCDKCGQKLLFPAFHWTICDGESPQIRTMTWGN